MTTMHDITVHAQKRTHGVFLDGTEVYRSNPTGAGQYATGMRKGLRAMGKYRNGRVKVLPVVPETPAETFRRTFEEACLCKPGASPHMDCPTHNPWRPA